MPPAPDRVPPSRQAGSPFSPQDRSKMGRAAALRPLNLVVLVVGAAVFAATLAWWVLLLTVATYTALIFLGTRDPILQNRVLGRELPEVPQERDLSPERRARWLPRGTTREKTDAALTEYRKVVAAIEGSDDVTLAVLEDALPKLHDAANRVVDVALQREKAAETVRDLRGRPDPGAAGSGAENLQRLEARVREADAEISATREEFLDLRAKVVRISIDTNDAHRADDLNASLNDLNARLDALGDVSQR